MTTKLAATRRGFLWTAGAALSAPLAVAAASGPKEAADAEAARLAVLEDVNAIRELQHAYARHLDAEAHAAATELFAEPSAAVVDLSIRGVSGVGFGADDAIELAADRRTATARLRCAVEVATPIGPDCTLVEMARAQGEGVLRRVGTRVLESVCVKQDGIWKIDSAAWRV